MKKLITILFLFTCITACTQEAVTLTIGVNSSYFPPQSGDITFTDAHFQYSRPGYAGTGFTARSPQGYVEFRTTETNISVKVGGNYSGHGIESDVDILVDGAYSQSIRLTADNTTQTTAITLPSGLKIVRLINGYTANDGANIYTPAYGTYVQGVVTTGNIQIKKPIEPEDKWLFVGNSITTGATATHPVSTSFTAQFREDGRAVELDSWGARLIGSPTTDNTGLFAEHSVSRMTGTSTNTLFLLLGTNDFFYDASKATFKTYYGRLIDSIHARNSSIRIICVSPIERSNYDTPNAGGATLDDYADAIQELLITRVWAEFIYGRPLVSLANLADGVHPNQAGHDEFHDNLLIAYNAL